MFRDSGRRGDELCRELIVALPDVLNDAGIATILISWSQPVDADTAAPVEWLEGGPCSALVLVSGAARAAGGRRAMESTASRRTGAVPGTCADWIKYFETEESNASVTAASCCAGVIAGLDGWRLFP